MSKFSKHKWWIVTALITVPLVAIAAVPNMFSPNTLISSTAVNQNFSALDARITALETSATAKTSATTVSGAINPITTGTGPRNATFTTLGGNPWLVIVSASAFLGGTAGGPLDLGIALDGVKIGDLQGYSNEVGSHKAIPTRTFTIPTATIPTPAADTHTIGISYGNANTMTDQNDYFSVTLVEMH